MGGWPPGGPVVEYTGGSGASLALVRAVKNHPLQIVTSDAFAREKPGQMRILGARLEIIPSKGGGMTERLTRDMIEAARVVAEATGACWTDQMNNRDFGGNHRRWLPQRPPVLVMETARLSPGWEIRR